MVQAGGIMNKKERLRFNYFLVFLGLFLVFAFFAFGNLFRFSAFAQLIDSLLGVQWALYLVMFLGVFLLSLLGTPVLLIALALIFQFFLSKLGVKADIASGIGRTYRGMLGFANSPFGKEKIVPRLTGAVEEARLIAYSFLFAVVFEALYAFTAMLFRLPFDFRANSFCSMGIVAKSLLGDFSSISSCPEGYILIVYCLILMHGLNGLGKLKWLDAFFSRG
jgi:hypothetical protein